MAPDSGTSRHGIRAFSRVTPRLVVSAAVALLVAGGGLALSAALGSAPSSVTIVRADANGATVHVGVGDRLELILSSDYWHVHGSSSAAVLTQDGSARYLPRPGSCPPLTGSLSALSWRTGSRRRAWPRRDPARPADLGGRAASAGRGLVRHPLPGSALARLAAGGIEYSNAQTPAPSDSFPGMVGQVTGGDPASPASTTTIPGTMTCFPPGRRTAPDRRREARSPTPKATTSTRVPSSRAAAGARAQLREQRDRRDGRRDQGAGAGRPDRDHRLGQARAVTDRPQRPCPGSRWPDHRRHQRGLDGRASGCQRSRCVRHRRRRDAVVAQRPVAGRGRLRQELPGHALGVRQRCQWQSRLRASVWPEDRLRGGRVRRLLRRPGR